jgi:plasmid stabilization system protein ParE
MGREVPEIGDKAVREIIVRSYRVVYRVQHSRGEVEIARFWHGARGTPKLTPESK